MDLTQLQYFKAAAEKGNFTQAAADLHITQPALSKMIAGLEGDLGCKLFDREGKRIRLNTCGELVLRHTNEIMDSLAIMQTELRDMSGTISGQVRIAFSIPAREPDPFLHIVKDFLDDNPDVQVAYKQGSAISIIDALRNKTVDVAITSSVLHHTVFPSADIEWRNLYREKMGIILSRSHPLTAKAELSLLDLKDESFFINNAGNDSRDLTYSFCERAGFTPKVRFEGHHPLYIGEAISRGDGVSFIPESQFRRQYLRDVEMGVLSWAENITFRPISDSFCFRDCGYAILKGIYHSQAVKDFCRRLDRAFLNEDG